MLGSSRGALDMSAIGASPLIMVALLSTCSERAKATCFRRLYEDTSEPIHHSRY